MYATVAHDLQHGVSYTTRAARQPGVTPVLWTVEDVYNAVA